MKTKLLDSLRLIWMIPMLEQVLVGMTQGKTFGSLISKMPPNHYQYKKGSKRIVRRGEINYQLDLSDIVDWFIYYGFVEEARNNLYDLIHKNDIVLDVGTNVGDVSMHAALLVGSKGQVHSFEPDPRNFNRFESNLNLNEFKNIQINPIGLGHEIASFKMTQVKEGNMGMNRIVKDEDANDAVEVQISTVDQYVLDKTLNRIDVVKIDVEGFEYNVLQGAKESIKKYHPTFFIELDDSNLKDQGSSASELIALLEEHQYVITHADHGSSISSDQNFEQCHYDIIAKHIK